MRLASGRTRSSALRADLGIDATNRHGNGSDGKGTRVSARNKAALFVGAILAGALIFAAPAAALAGLSPRTPVAGPPWGRHVGRPVRTPVDTPESTHDHGNRDRSHGNKPGNGLGPPPPP